MSIAASIAAVLLSGFFAIAAGLLNKKWYYDSEDFEKYEGTYERLEKTVNKKVNDSLYQSDLKKRAKDEKNADKLSKELDFVGQKLQMMKMKAGLVSTFSMFIGYWMLRQFYPQAVVLKLPFAVPFLLRFFTHRGLAGDDYSQISVGFVFFLSTIFFRRYADRTFGKQLPSGLVERSSFSHKMAEIEKRAQKEE